MRPETKQIIDRATDVALRGGIASREEIVAMLELDYASDEVEYLKECAVKVAKKASKGRGCLSGAIGVDLCSCDMNCKFCSFGTAWGLVTENVKYTKEEVIYLACAYVEAGVTTLTLRSTEFYSQETLRSWLADIRAAAPGDYAINLNVGEMSPAMAEAAYQAGATSAYHVVRLGEGDYTPFDPAVRERTARTIADSPLRLGTCLEPIGSEHTNEELADRILFNMSLRPYGMGVMFRVNVPGTPFQDYPEIPLERRLQILAATRIAVGTQIRSMGMHPAAPESLYAGGNSFTIELGANPRDVAFNDREWRGFTADEAKRLLAEAGFPVETINPDPRFRAGAHWWHGAQTDGDLTMPDPFEKTGAGCCCTAKA